MSGEQRSHDERPGRRSQEQPHEGEGGHGAGAHGGGHSQLTREDRLAQLRSHHRQTLWVYWTLVLLGAWTLVSPLTFGYGDPVASPGGGRALWLPEAARVSLMT